jgi:hypothetical protein
MEAWAETDEGLDGLDDAAIDRLDELLVNGRHSLPMLAVVYI